MKKIDIVNLFLYLGFIASISFSFLCFFYILSFPHSNDGISALNMINTFGNLAQKSLLFTTFSAIVADILKTNFNKK